jgi:mannose-6-phosphate isomerase-like protein (cupin superfamily)
VIVSGVHGGLTRTVDDRAGEAVWRCLGRRGMLYSECESFDYVRLAPGAVIDERGRADIEEAWFVLHGAGEFLDDEGRSLPVREGDLLLRPQAACGHWRSNADSPLELLLIAVMPAAVSRRLPIRTPVL